VLIIVRHGETQANQKGLLLGRSESRLTELGELQAKRIAFALINNSELPLKIISSPLDRALKTAEIIRQNLQAKLDAMGVKRTLPEVEKDQRWIELDYGEMDLLPISEVPSEFWISWRKDLNFKPEHGETLLELQKRVKSALSGLKEQAASGHVLVVTHVSPIKAAVAWALNCSLEVNWNLHVKLATITRIRTGPGAKALVSFGESLHLIGTNSK
jgi:broad specificity phosphatase PhoE